MEEGLTPGQAGVGEPKPSRGGGGAGAPREGQGPEAGELLTGSRSRHSGPSWQRAKRTAQVGRGPPTRPGPGPQHRQGGAWCFPAGEGAGQGLRGQKGPPCPKGWLGSVVEDQDLRPLPEPSPSLTLEEEEVWKGPGGKQSFHSQSHTHAFTKRNTPHVHTHADTLI